MIEEDLQAPVHTLFASISSKPVAAASLGQVYKAELASDGSVVAVKVRPIHRGSVLAAAAL